MSRSFERESTDRFREEHPNSRMPLSQGRTGGSGSGDADDGRRENRSSTGGGLTESVAAGFAAAIDEAAVGKPTMSEFIARLEGRGIQAIPSIQSSGRLNGMSYGRDGLVIKGSSIGRAYTAQGLQERKGVSFDPDRDGSALRQAREHAGIQDPERVDRPAGSDRGREARLRDSRDGLSADQRRTLAEVGRFRAVAADDLVKHRYGGDSGRFNQDMRVLSEAGLAQRRSVEHVRSGAKFDVVVLTQRGRNELRSSARKSGDGQQYYAGFVKATEIRHDIGLYRMYQAEAARIEREGGTVRRVVLDFELKKNVFSAANRGGQCDPGYEARKAQAAEDHGLKVVQGKVVFPDLRIEYETRDQEMDKVDLELATGDYKSSQVRAKHAAGLKIYAPDSAAGSPAIQDPEIVAELISI